jgi:hypothetical protein
MTRLLRAQTQLMHSFNSHIPTTDALNSNPYPFSCFETNGCSLHNPHSTPVDYRQPRKRDIDRGKKDIHSTYPCVAVRLMSLGIVEADKNTGTPPLSISHGLLPLELVLHDGERLLKQILLLLGVERLEARGDRRAGAATGVHDVLPVVVLRLVEQRLDARLREAPRARVERLLLRPHNRLGVGVLVEVLAQLLPREGVQLLDARDGHIVNVVVGAVLVQRRVHLARAEDDALHLVVRLEGARLVRRVGDDPLELRVARELLKVGAGQGVAKKRLGEEDDEGCKS